MRFKTMMAAGVSLLAASLLFLFRQVPTAHAATGDAPAYAGNGDMLPVANYREWIYLSSGVDMSYSPQPADMTMFDNVFVNPGGVPELRSDRNLAGQDGARTGKP